MIICSRYKACFCNNCAFGNRYEYVTIRVLKTPLSLGRVDTRKQRSAGKKKSVRITRAGVYLKPALVEIAHAAVKSKQTPYYAIKYERISKRRGKKRAMIAIARMILTAIFHMFSSGEVWNPVDLNQIDIPPELRDKEVQKSLRRAVKLLISHGLISPGSIQIPEAAPA